MKIAVVGCGAVGSFYGSQLCRAGHDVHFLLRSDYDAVRFRGEIEGALTKVVGATADTAYARLLQGRARELLELLKKDDRAAYAARVRKYEGYP